MHHYFLCIFLAVAVLSGCTDTNSRQEARTFHHESIVVSGSVSIPMKTVQADGSEHVQFVEAPLTANIQRDIDAGTDTDTNTKTNVDMSAVSGAIGTALKAGLSQFAPGIAQFMSSAPPKEGMTKDVITSLLAAATIAATGYAAKQRGSTAELKKQIDFHKADASEAWNQIKETARETARYQPSSLPSSSATNGKG